jgi:hypothetical protein
MKQAMGGIRNLRISVSDGTTTLSFDSAFGPLTFSFRAESLFRELERFRSASLTCTGAEDPAPFESPLAKASEDLSLRTRSGIREFEGSRNMAVEGTAHLIIDSLPMGIILMLDHLSIVAMESSGVAKSVENDVSKLHGVTSDCRYVTLDHSIAELVQNFRDEV